MAQISIKYGICLAIKLIPSGCYACIFNSIWLVRRTNAEILGAVQWHSGELLKMLLNRLMAIQRALK